jgi:hypothetical protein
VCLHLIQTSSSGTTLRTTCMDRIGRVKSSRGPTRHCRRSLSILHHPLVQMVQVVRGRTRPHRTRIERLGGCPISWCTSSCTRCNTVNTGGLRPSHPLGVGPGPSRRSGPGCGDLRLHMRFQVAYLPTSSIIVPITSPGFPLALQRGTPGAPPWLFEPRSSNFAAPAGTRGATSSRKVGS